MEKASPTQRSGRRIATAKLGALALAPNAKTQIGVVSMPKPPPKPALEKPMNSTPMVANKMVVRCGIRDTSAAENGHRAGLQHPAILRSNRLARQTEVFPKEPCVRHMTS